MKIIAFAGSNSSTSINYKLLKYITSNNSELEIELIRVLDLYFPMYSEDTEKAAGFPDAIKQLYESIKDADALILGVNEHNGNPSAYLKNILDWLSRIHRKFLENKCVLLISSSPGGGGGKRAVAVINSMLPHMGASSINSYSLPSFYENFSTEKNEIVNDEITSELEKVLRDFEAQI